MVAFANTALARLRTVSQDASNNGIDRGSTVQALRHCRVEVDEAGLDWLTLDAAEAATNALSLELIEDLHSALDTIEANGSHGGLVLASAKPAGFAVGLSGPALAQLDDRVQARELVERAQALSRRIAEWRAPTAAILHGVCQGGGLELALAATYRVAAGNNTRLGFPEINLGLHPYCGGTARLSKLIGLAAAQNLLLTGRMIGVGEAQRLGLVDRITTADGGANAAHAMIAERPQRSGPRLIQRVLSSVPVRWSAELIRRTDYREFVIPDSHPGATAMYELWWRYAASSTVRRIAAERDSILQLVQQRGTRNSIRVFLLQEQCAITARDQSAEPPQHVHIIGCGSLGTQLGAAFAAKGVGLTFQDRSTEAESAAIERARAAAAASGRSEDAIDSIAGSDGGEAHDRIAQADFVIEAVDEDAANKQSVLEAIAAHVAADTPLATTTSLLSISRIASAVPQPERVLGLHFQVSLSALTLAPIVEIVQGEQTSADAVASALGAVLQIDHLPVVVGDCPGFLINRLLLPYILAGAEHYTRPQREAVDGAARYMGMRVGPLELADWIGLDRCARLATAIAGGSDEALPVALREKVDSGHYGRPTGHGFHDWRGYKRVTSAMPPRHEPLNVLGPTLIKPLVEEAERCRSQSMVADVETLEVAAVIGAGFPSYTGGPLRYRQQVIGSQDPAGGATKGRSWRDRIGAWASGDFR